MSSSVGIHYVNGAWMYFTDEGVALSIPQQLSEEAACFFWAKSEELTLRGALGAGGQGRVYKAWHVPRQCLVAVKLLEGAPDTISSLPVVPLEYSVGRRVQSPHVVQALEYVAWRSVYAIALEYCGLGTLEDFLREGSDISLPQVNFTIVQLMRGLEALHSAGYAHLDIKPSNIMLGESGDRVLVRINDLGSVSRLNADFLCVSGGGFTDGYIDPAIDPDDNEQLFNGVLADVYSSGIVLSEMLEELVAEDRREFSWKLRLQALAEVMTSPVEAWLAWIFKIASSPNPADLDLLVPPWVLSMAVAAEVVAFLGEMLPGTKSRVDQQVSGLFVVPRSSEPDQEEDKEEDTVTATATPTIITSTSSSGTTATSSSAAVALATLPGTFFQQGTPAEEDEDAEEEHDGNLENVKENEDEGMGEEDEDVRAGEGGMETVGSILSATATTSISTTISTTTATATPSDANAASATSGRAFAEQETVVDSGIDLVFGPAVQISELAAVEVIQDTSPEGRADRRLDESACYSSSETLVQSEPNGVFVSSAAQKSYVEAAMTAAAKADCGYEICLWAAARFRAEASAASAGAFREFPKDGTSDDAARVPHARRPWTPATRPPSPISSFLSPARSLGVLSEAPFPQAMAAAASSVPGSSVGLLQSIRMPLLVKALRSALRYGRSLVEGQVGGMV
ncbi:kinase-like domain-containing protein [Zopfochytrium polystomum]|nr:kinase-like domain-containing protein [Zopfochytrium polystomum]